MRNMSFMLTQQQILDRTKRQTRRLAWVNLLPNTLLRAVDQCQGLKRGQHPIQLAIIRVEYNHPEPLSIVRQEDVIEEGFPDYTPKMFIEFFCDHMKCEPSRIVQAIRFNYEDEIPKLI